MFLLVFNINKSVPRVSDFVSAQPQGARSVHLSCTSYANTVRYLIHGPCALDEYRVLVFVLILCVGFLLTVPRYLTSTFDVVQIPDIELNSSS